jgi:dUTP pyrophosphatase
VFRAGDFVAEHVTPTDADQVQPNGVDLTVDAILEPVEAGRIGRDGKRIGEREPVGPTDGSDGPPAYHLDPGAYVAQYGERIAVPDDHVGFVYPRSSLMRNGGMLNTAVWDAGYEGRGEGLLQVHHPIAVEPGARIAQFVLAAADHRGTYDGSYQAERL